MTQSQQVEKREFTAEVGKLLDLVVHSLYSEREIFLRELLANSADATDKRRFEALTDATLSLPSQADIVVKADEKNKTLTISDQGLGMTRDEMVENLGSIARSGTHAFSEKLKSADQSDKPSLIGQFGVGFYSAFMVADRVSVVSRRAGSDKAWEWSSDGKGSYELRSAERATPGTDVILHVKKDAEEFLSAGRIREITGKWVSYLAWPVKLETENDKGETEQSPLNDGKALWRQKRKDVEQEAYTAFYRKLTHNFDAPLETLHWSAEGVPEFSALLFIPENRPFDWFSKQERESRVQLYVRRLFITEDAGLLPPWLRFVQGVVDTEDLPLNVSREMLQTTPVLARIRKAVTGRVMREIESLARTVHENIDKKDGEISPENKDKFIRLWDAFGAVLKEGIWEDAEYRQTLAKNALFRTTRDPKEWTSLDAYIGRMKEGQEYIYYVNGEHLSGLEHSAQVEGFKARGLEVLLLTDPVDNFWPERLHAYEGKVLKSVNASLGDLDKFPIDESLDRGEKAEIKALIDAIKDVLKEEVTDVRETERLTSSPFALGHDHGADFAMRRMLQRSGQDIPASAPVLELNPYHPLIKSLAEKAAKKEDLGLYPRTFLELGRLQEGEPLQNPSDFARTVADLLSANLKG